MNVWFTEWKTATIESASLHIKKLQPNQIPQTETERVLLKKPPFCGGGEIIESIMF